MFDRLKVPGWLVWLGWTLLFGLGCLGSVFVNVAWGIRYEVLIAFVLGLAFLIGLAFPSWWWPLGPPVVVVVPLIVLYLVVGSYTIYFLFVAPPFVGALALAAWVGVWLGKRRERHGSDSSRS